MKRSFEATEKKRLIIQADLDKKKSQKERNQLGQFATPTVLAKDILRYGLSLLPKDSKVSFLDPAIGTGSFYSALRSTSTENRIVSAKGFEVDSHYGDPAIKLWKDTPLEIHLEDFTTQSAANHGKANLCICNPPYVRHQHLTHEEKKRLYAKAKETSDIKLSGLAGLYCYFMGITHPWLAKDGISGWLIPSEFMDVNYGRELKQYLLNKVTLLHIHRFDPNDKQFDDALVSSAVVWFKNSKPSKNHSVKFTYGGTLTVPKLEKKISLKDLELSDKWTRFPAHDPLEPYKGWRLNELFKIKRGLATGDNKFFIVDESKAKKLKLPPQFLQPILPSSRYIDKDEIASDTLGVPLLEKRLYLINCNLSEEEVKRDFPTLWEYYQTGKEDVSSRYLCKSRRAWYFQENRPSAPIVCTYIGRTSNDKKNPFRFLLNNSKATATNVFLMLYPQNILAERISKDPDLTRLIWSHLNNIPTDTLVGNGRVYGGGMHKLEPKELGNVPADDLATLAGLPDKGAEETSKFQSVA